LTTATKSFFIKSQFSLVLFPILDVSMFTLALKQGYSCLKKPLKECFLTVSNLFSIPFARVVVGLSRSVIATDF
jgi:hypothetical protein